MEKQYYIAKVAIIKNGDLLEVVSVAGCNYDPEIVILFALEKFNIKKSMDVFDADILGVTKYTLEEYKLATGSAPPWLTIAEDE